MVMCHVSPNHGDVSTANSQGFGDLYSRLVGCPSNLTAVQRLGCLRDLPLKDVLEPYLDWFCPVARPEDPWCTKNVSDRYGGVVAAGSVGPSVGGRRRGGWSAAWWLFCGPAVGWSVAQWFVGATAVGRWRLIVGRRRGGC